LVERLLNSGKIYEDQLDSMIKIVKVEMVNICVV